MVYYPSFTADPNSVPKVNGLPGLINGIQKGMMMAQLPEKMRNERQQSKLSLEKAQMENEYYPQQMRANINEANARAYLAQQEGQDLDPRALLNYLQNNGQNSNTASYPRSPNMNMQQPQQAQNPYSQPQNMQMSNPNQVNDGKMATPQTSPIQSNSSLPAQEQNSPYKTVGTQNYLISNGNPELYGYDEAYENDPAARRYLERHGYGKSISTQIDPTGKLVSITKYPSGKQEANILETGGGIEGKAFEEEEGKNRATALQKYRDKYAATSNIDQNISQLKSLVENPEFADSVGPLNNVLVTKFGKGSPVVKRLNGQMKTYSGQIQAEMATSIPGNAAKAKIRFVQDIKPDTNDTSEGLIGKLEALDTANKWSQNYNQFVTKAMENGLSEEEALAQANNAFPWDSSKSNMEKIMKQGEIAGQLRQNKLNIQRSKNGQFYVLVPTEQGGQWLPTDQYDQYMQQYNKNK